MDEKTKQELIKNWEEERNGLQNTMHLMREERKNIQFGLIKDLRGHSLKLAELSIGIGAAIGPLLFITDKLEGKEFYIFIAVGFFILSGLIGLFREKFFIEKNINETRLIGMDMEIDLYPRVYLLNKLMMNPEDQELMKDYIEGAKDIPMRYTSYQKNLLKLDYFLDFQYLFMLLGILSLIKPMWPIPDHIFVAIVLVVLTLFVIQLAYSIYNAKKTNDELNEKQETLSSIHETFINWHNKDLLPPKDAVSK